MSFTNLAAAADKNIAAGTMREMILVSPDAFTITNLKKYHAIMGEVGTQDGLAAANRQMDQILGDFGIAHTFETYDGDHTNRVVERIEQKVLPFFSKNLKR